MIFNNELVKAATNELESLKEYLRILFIQNRHLLKNNNNKESSSSSKKNSFYTLTASSCDEYNSNKNIKSSTTMADYYIDVLGLNTEPQDDDSGFLSNYSTSINESSSNNNNNNNNTSTVSATINSKSKYDYDGCKSCSHCLALRFFLMADLKQANYLKLYTRIAPLINSKYATDLNSLVSRNYGHLIKLKSDETKLALYEWDKYRLALNYFLITHLFETNSASAANSINIQYQSYFNHHHNYNQQQQQLSQNEKFLLCDMHMHYTFENDVIMHKFLFYMLKKWSKEETSMLNFNNYLHFGIPRPRVLPLPPIKTTASNEYSSLDDELATTTNNSQDQQSLDDSFNILFKDDDNENDNNSNQQQQPKKSYYIYKRPPVSATTTTKKEFKRSLADQKQMSTSSLVLNGSLCTSHMTSSLTKIAATSNTRVRDKNNVMIMKRDSSMSSLNNLTLTTNNNGSSGSGNNNGNKFGSIRCVKRAARGIYNRTMRSRVEQRKQLEKLELELIQKSLSNIHSRSDLNLVEGGIVTNTNIYYPLNILKQREKKLRLRF